MRRSGTPKHAFKEGGDEHKKMEKSYLINNIALANVTP